MKTISGLLELMISCCKDSLTQPVDGSWLESLNGRKEKSRNNVVSSFFK